MRNVAPLVLLLFSSLALTSCGGNGNSAPTGSTISINPSTIPWTISATATVCGGPYNFVPVAITVKNAQGIPLNNVDLYISIDLADNTYTGTAVVLLYDDPTWQGNATTIPQNQKTIPYVTKTDGYGTKRVIVGVDLGCPWKANFNVYSGSAFGTMNIAVTAG